MPASQAVQADTGNQADECYDAIIIGPASPDVSALSAAEVGLSVRVFGPAAGWWHLVLEPLSGRPLRFRKYTYGYSFSEELLQEWNWSEHFAAQPETCAT